MKTHHTWSAEIYENLPGDGNTVKTPMTPVTFVAKRLEDDQNTHLILSLDPFRQQGAPYNLNHRMLSVKLTEKSGDSVIREWNSRFFLIDRTCKFDTLLVGVLDDFEDQEWDEPLFDRLRDKDIRCIAVNPNITVCTCPWKKDRIATHAVAISVRIPDPEPKPSSEERPVASPDRTTRPPSPAQPPSLPPVETADDTKPASQKKKKKKRAPNRTGKMSRARMVSRRAMNSRSRGDFERNKEEAIALMSEGISELKRKLTEAEDSMRSYKRLRFEPTHSPVSHRPASRDTDVRVTFRNDMRWHSPDNRRVRGRDPGNYRGRNHNSSGSRRGRR